MCRKGQQVNAQPVFLLNGLYKYVATMAIEYQEVSILRRDTTKYRSCKVEKEIQKQLFSHPCM